MNTKTLSLVALIFFAIMILFNVLSAFGIIGGASPQDVSDMNWTLITPAAFTFSIWSLIYILMFITVVLSFMRAESEQKKHFISSYSALFILSSVLNIAWNITFNMQWMVVSSVMIFLLLVTLSVMTILARDNPQMSMLYPLSTGLYSGWVFIATVVNIAATLVSKNWNGFGISESFWGIFITIIAVILSVGVGILLRNPILPIPIAWAFVGIGFELMNKTDHSINMVLSFIAAGVMLIFSGFLFTKYGLRRAKSSEEKNGPIMRNDELPLLDDIKPLTEPKALDTTDSFDPILEEAQKPLFDSHDLEEK